MKKMFGIGTVILMMLVAIAPAINSSQLSTEKESGWNIEVAGFGNWDLNIDFQRCYFEKKYVKNNQRFVEYRIEYNVSNVGTEEYVNDGTLMIGASTEEITIAPWEINIPTFFMPGPSVGVYVHRVELGCSENPSIDQERLFAAKMIKLEFVETVDSNPSNDFDYEFAQQWNEKVDYTPTVPQVEVSAPHWYNKIYCVPEIPDLYKLDFFDVRILPAIIKSERMGWTGEAAAYLTKIGKDVGEIIGTTVAFLLLIKNDIKIVAQWIVDFIEWFYATINGIFYGGLIELIHDFITYVLPAVGRISAEAAIWGGTVAVLCLKLYNDVDSMYNWTLSDPWDKPIKIKGVVDRVKIGEIITVSCRDQVKEYPDPDNDGRIEYGFLVSSEPIGNEKHNWSIHKCVVTVKGSKHKEAAQSPPLLSYAFSNGTVYTHFLSPDGNYRDRGQNMLSFVERIKGFVKSRPLISLLEKIFKKSDSSDETETSIERDFDLDALVQNAKEEEEGYELFEGVYKEYYPGAPASPNIVYFSSDQVLVGFKSYVDVTEIDDVLGYPVVDTLVELNVVVVEIYGIDPEDFIEQAEQLEDVEYAELDYVYQTCYIPDDPLWGEQWGNRAIKCPQAWDITMGNQYSGVDIAILDTGRNKNHEDLPRSTSYLDYDFVNNDDEPDDDCYVKHGTHCAGIIGAVADNDKGIAGVVQRITMHYGKVLDYNGAGYSSNIAKAIVHMAKSGDIEIISMSLGGYGLSLVFHIACDYAYSIKDVLIVAAAGNDGLSRLCYPARFESVISVGAVDEKLELCSWSNHGPDLDVVAPGNNIISTYQLSGEHTYEKLSGTSMATPHVAGVLALYLCENPYDKIVCKYKLFSTAMSVENGGHGLVNAYGMLKSRARSYENFQEFLNSFPGVQQFFTNLINS